MRKMSLSSTATKTITGRMEPPVEDANNRTFLILASATDGHALAAVSGECGLL